MATKHQMRKTNREDGDVAGSPWTKIQGRSNITHSTGPNMQEGVGGRKRRADGEEEMPRKRMRSSYFTNPTGHREGPVRNRNLQRGERKDCVDAGPSKTTRCRINNTSAVPSVVDNHLVGPRKRKATDDGDTPESKRRCGTNSSHSVNMNSEEDEDEVSSSLTEEERIFKLSSIQNLSKGKLTEGNKSFDISSNINIGQQQKYNPRFKKCSFCVFAAGYKDKYCELFLLGNGGYGSVYAGFRKSDSLPVSLTNTTSCINAHFTIIWVST